MTCLCSWLLAATAFVQPQPSGALTITSPANGVVFAPGQIVTVAVSSPSNAKFSAILVGGDGGLGLTQPAQSLPARFTLTIPSQIACRRYSVTAFGVTASGSESFARIEIDVERPDLPRSVEPETREISFGAEGEQGRIDLSASFGDGSVLDVTRSSKVTYTSSDPAVATVDVHGMVTAVAEGEAEIVATYGPPDAHVSVTIPVDVPASLLLAAPRTIGFGNRPVGTPSTQRMTLTNASYDDLSVTKVTTTGDYVQTNDCAALSPLKSGGSCSITITFQPATAGPRPGAVVVETNVHIFPLTFPLTGTGGIP